MTPARTTPGGRLWSWSTLARAPTTTATATTIAPPVSAAVTPPSFTARGRLAGATSSFIAQAVGPQVAIYEGPGAEAPVRSLSDPQPSGAPLVLLVTEQRGGWLQVSSLSGPTGAPTPGGLYYIKELFQPLDAAGRLNPGGLYGPYAYGLSGYSDVLHEFGGGDGQIGIHGTDDPAGLGFDVSHGCIRMSNAGITDLAGILPWGVPVEILP